MPTTFMEALQCGSNHTTLQAGSPQSSTVSWLEVTMLVPLQLPSTLKTPRCGLPVFDIIQKRWSIDSRDSHKMEPLQKLMQPSHFVTTCKCDVVALQRSALSQSFFLWRHQRRRPFEINIHWKTWWVNTAYPPWLLGYTTQGGLTEMVFRKWFQPVVQTRATVRSRAPKNPGKLKY